MKAIILIPPSEGKAEDGHNEPVKAVSGITPDLIKDCQVMGGFQFKAVKK